MNTIIKKVISAVTAVALLSTAAVFKAPEMMAQTEAEVTGEGYTFDPDTGKLTVTSNDGTTGWRENEDISKEAVISVYITDGVWSIGDEAFQDCTELTSVNFLSDMVMVETIGKSAFSNCLSLAVINIPVMVRQIGANAFYGSGLTSVIIPQGVHSIGEQAFGPGLEYAICSSYIENAENVFESSTTQLQYSVLSNDGFEIAEIILGDGIDSFTITDEMNICFVDEEIRTNVAQTGHTHIYDEGREENNVKTSNCVICNAVNTETVNSHEHCLCVNADCTDPDHSHENITWEGINDLSDLTSGGHYYLTEKISLSSEIVINGDITLCLNGHTITANSNSRIFNIAGSGSLTLCDCCGSGNLTKGRTQNYGSAVQINGGSFIMYSGTIKDNEAVNVNGQGSGCIDVNSGSFIMNGGKISDNWSYSGGGVMVGENATFTMNGGEISGNLSRGNGGGVYVNGTFTMNNGVISQNIANYILNHGYNGGGGVYVSYNAGFTMNGGTISENRTNYYGGGVYVSGGERYNVNITLNGNVGITDNKNGGGNSNIYLTSYAKLTIEDNFSPQTPIGIASGKVPTCTDYVDLTEALSSDLSGSFTADREGEIVTYNETEKTLQLAAEHTWSEWETTTLATCTEKGEQSRQCSVCNKTDTKEISLIEHSCGTDWITDDTYHWHECSVCKGEIDKAEHAWGDGEITVQPTCIEDGERTYTCFCGKTKTESITAKHSFEGGEWGSDENDHWNICTVCNTAVSEKAAHIWGNGEITVQPTCTKEGVRTYTCICGRTKTEPIPAAEHSFSEKWESDDTNHWHICESCNTEKSENTAHTWDEGKVTTDTTEDSEGVRTFTCTVCSRTKTEPIPKLGHTHTYSDTWSSDETGHWHEATCGHDVKGSAGEHDFGEPAVTPSTCTQAGSEVSVCRICQYEKKVTLPLSEHAFDGGDWESDENSHWKICTVCHTAKSEEAAHTWDNGTVTKQPTTDEPGEKTFECTVCGKSKTEAIPAAGNEDNPENPGDPSNPENPDDPDKRNISTEVQPGENVPDTEIGTPLDELIEAVLTPEEQELAGEGVEIKIVLTVEDGTGSVSDEDRKKVETVINENPGYKLGQYLNVNLLKVIGNDQEKVTETCAPITVIFAVPEELRAKVSTCTVIRVHNGETVVLPDLDGGENTVTIATDRFSTYVLAYTEKTSVTPPGTYEPGGSDFILPDVSGTQSGEPEPSESGTDSSGDPESAESKFADNSDTKPAESETTDGYVTPSESGGAATNNGTELPGGETVFNGESGTVSGNDAASADNGSMSGENAANKNNDGNPSTGIALSFIPLAAAAAALTAAVKRKKK